MEEIKHILHFLAEIIDIIGIIVVMWGFCISLVRFVGAELGRISGRWGLHGCHDIRVELGTYILLGIEFMIASDLINTVLSRQLEDLIIVSALVVIRTAISYFLNKEIEALRRHQPD